MTDNLNRIQFVK